MIVFVKESQPLVVAAAPCVPLFGLALDPVDMAGAVERIYSWIETGARGRFVVTPNVDHTVLLQRDGRFRAAYANASLVLADGMPIVTAARLLGQPLPERVSGSDLAPALFEAAAERGGLRVYLLGAAPGVAAEAARRITARWPAVKIAGTFSPPPGFEYEPRLGDEILERLAAARPDVVVVGLGAPKQEIWVNEHHDRIDAPATLCVGATIDFLAGHRKRAPQWMRRAGLEWLYRLAGEPRRLLARYARDAWVFPRLVWREYAALRRRRPDGATVRTD
jgi:N-acetylglucosaminyldiphosphoundecaprenol N-acetyl-beta-D-mannosaminyltransferase